MIRIAETSMLDTIQDIQSDDLTVHPERCTVVRHQKSNCKKCVDACASSAISVIDGQIHINFDLCIGCGTCATICPTSALEANKPRDHILLNSLLTKAENNSTAIACSEIFYAYPNLDSNRVTEVRCLGRIDETLLVGAASKGITNILLFSEKCKACKFSPGYTCAKKIAESTNNLLNAWNFEFHIEFTETIPNNYFLDQSHSENTNTYLFGFKNIADKPKEQSLDKKVTYDKVNDLGVLPQFKPEKREQLLDYLLDIGEPIQKVIDTRLWGYISIDTSCCSSCRMCSVFCPTGAITYVENDNSVWLENRPADCLQCRLCTDICHWNALTLSSTVPIHKLIDATVEIHPLNKIEHKPGDVDAIIDSMRKLIKNKNFRIEPR